FAGHRTAVIEFSTSNSAEGAPGKDPQDFSRQDGLESDYYVPDSPKSVLVFEYDSDLA
ncbi:hypothetical protein BGZ79_008702, partial [Entomortierella chlamydospora]